MPVFFDVCSDFLEISPESSSLSSPPCLVGVPLEEPVDVVMEGEADSEGQEARGAEGSAEPAEASSGQGGWDKYTRSSQSHFKTVYIFCQN